MTNDYEKSLLQSKAGLTDAQLLDRVKVRVTTLGKHGVEIAGRDVEPIHVPIAREIQADRPDRRRRRLPGRLLRRPVLGARPGARRPGRLAAGHPGAGDRRHPGVRGPPRPVRQAARRVVRRRRRRGRPAAPARHDAASLVAFAGLPGVGKSTLAGRVGAALRAPVLPVDPVERALARHGLTGRRRRGCPATVGLVGVRRGGGLAEVQLGLGLSVVVRRGQPGGQRPGPLARPGRAGRCAAAGDRGVLRRRGRAPPPGRGAARRPDPLLPDLGADPDGAARVRADHRPPAGGRHHHRRSTRFPAILSLPGLTG